MFSNCILVSTFAYMIRFPALGTHGQQLSLAKILALSCDFTEPLLLLIVGWKHVFPVYNPRSIGQCILTWLLKATFCIITAAACSIIIAISLSTFGRNHCENICCWRRCLMSVYFHCRSCLKDSDDYGAQMELCLAGPQLLSIDFERALDSMQSSQADAIGSPKARF